MVNPIWTTVIWTAIAAIIAAVVSGILLRALKISEFRQAWINDLRKDIADYLGAANLWLEKYIEINDLDPEGTEKLKRAREELFPIAKDARVILYRIKLRFSPKENRFKDEDDDFLKALDDALNPGLLDPDNIDVSWQKRAEDVTLKARHILKREWEVTKNPFAVKSFPGRDLKK